MRDKIVAGNWKMNMNKSEAHELFIALQENIKPINNGVNVIIAPPFIYLSDFATSSINIASQNCSEHKNGAYTGEISAEMLSSIGVKYCIVGHSERREYYLERNDLLKQKVDTLLSNNIVPIYCCGETLKQREEGEALSTVSQQIKEGLFHLNEKEISQVIVAYEPVWAIGTGKTATSDQAQEMHHAIRKLIEDKYGNVANEISILYGGSVKPDNAKELFAQEDIDGGLIGGASLKVDSFVQITQSF